MKKNILVPLDFSDCSKNALKNAIEIAIQLDLGLHIVHSYLLPAHVSMGGVIDMADNISNVVEKEFEYEFEHLKREFPRLAEIEYKHSLKEGELSLTIKEFAQMEDIELIVMGTHGVKGIKEFIMGSNTYTVIKETHLPVMIFPEKSGLIKFDRLAFLSGMKKIEHPKVLKPLLKLVMKTKAEVDIIHFIKQDHINVKESRQVNDLILNIGEIRHSYHISDYHEIETAIHEYVIKHKIDLLVMIPRKHNFFELLFGKDAWAQKMIFHTTTPLFVLPS